MLKEIRRYYTKAVRTTLLANDKQTNDWFHLFSVLELQPTEAYPYHIPTDGWKDGSVRPTQQNFNHYNFYLNVDTIESVDEAIDLFHNPQGNFTIDGQTIKFFNQTFIQEPSGDFPLVLPPNIYDTDGLSSVLPKRNSGIFVWCQIDPHRNTEDKFIQVSETKEMAAIRQLTKDWLGFDLISQPEHIGNTYLSAPNPYFRSIDFSLSPNPIGIKYNILWRGGILEPLIFRFVDAHQGKFTAFDKTFEVQNSSGLIELPHEPHFFELRIYNKNGNLIALHEPSTFVKTIQFGMSVKEADLHIKVENGKEKKDIFVEKYSKKQYSMIGERADFNPRYYFDEAKRKRKHIVHAKNKEFIFFPGSKNEKEKAELKAKAKNAIHDILNQARDFCYICDPYFSGTDIIYFAFYINNMGVNIRILNSKEYMKSEAPNIIKIVSDYNKSPFGKIEVRTLKGKSILHDRFIVCDNDVWFIGSSFNEFGNRATCIAKVPESSDSQIISEIEKWYTEDEYSEDISICATELQEEMKNHSKLIKIKKFFRRLFPK
jgi:hypothetical protein